MAQSTILPSENVISEWFKCNDNLNVHEWKNDVLKEASGGFIYDNYKVYKKYKPYSNRIMKDAKFPNSEQAVSL